MSHPKTALILIDHGSRMDRANQLLEEIAERLRARNEYSIVATAHMELAEPTLGEAFTQCVHAGAGDIVIVPYFLAEGTHVTKDIPQLAREAAARHPEVTWRLAEPLGFDENLIEVILSRARDAK